MTNKHSPAPWSVYYDDDGVEIRADGNILTAIKAMTVSIAMP